MSIEINNLSKKFKEALVVKNINFELKKGSIIGLLGPNGCGKTTTIGMILGLIKPSSGNVLINGVNIEKEKNRTKILEKINFISPYVELPKKLTIEENLKVYGKLYGVNNLNEKIPNLMQDLNLIEFRNRKTGELSSGQKNRVSLAKALINEPEILLLDEPTASLDPDIGDYIRTYIEKFASKKNTTILLASHNMNEVTRLCKTVLMMKEGIIIDRDNIKLAINSDVMPTHTTGNNDTVLPILWSDSIMFQKLQHYVHGDISMNDYLSYFRDCLSNNDPVLPIYCNDAEIFDYRPGRFSEERPTHHEGEWNRIRKAINKIRDELRIDIVLPSDALKVSIEHKNNVVSKIFSIPAIPNLRLLSFSSLVPVAKTLAP